MSILSVPQTFLWRRLHSLMGLWFVLFLCEHLLTNSQAALWLGDNGQGFVRLVNAIHNCPYLEVVEIALIGIPVLIHMAWGVKYLFTGKFNHGRTDGSHPHIALPRNRAYSWQRITSWILLIGVLGHVTKFRFLEYPQKVHVGGSVVYLANLSMDDGLYTVADRLGVALYDSKAITTARQDDAKAVWIQALEKQHLAVDHVIAVTKDFGTASLLTVRNTFKNPIFIGLYTIFILAACFHACNGFWTFLFTWGWILKMAAQRAWVTVSVVLMTVLIFLGLAAIFGTYWLNLRY